MGAFILAALVFFVFLISALLIEFARGMTTAPSMYESYFWRIVGTGFVVAVIIVATHWLPRIGW
jgi:hypothetical protein